MTQGMSLEYFEAMMSALVNTGKLVKRGDCYFAPLSTTDVPAA
jgi:hypothetical protein